jgi:hypothetical protein
MQGSWQILVENGNLARAAADEEAEYAYDE